MASYLRFSFWTNVMNSCAVVHHYSLPPPTHTHTQRLDCLQISNQVVIFSQIETNFKQLNTDDYLGHSIHEFTVFLARLMLV